MTESAVRLSEVGEAKRRRQTLAEMLASSNGCIYCAGANAATTIEHMPPKSMFEAKFRPKGLEFPACADCNHGSKHSDLVASTLARCLTNADTEVARADVLRLLRAVSNNVPAVLREMHIGRAGEKLARKRRNIPDDAHPLRADGPVLNKHIHTFTAKLGFALHYEVTGNWIPAGGGVQVMWFSNVQALNDEIPSILFEMLPTPVTLRQGAKSVDDQFQYSYARAEQDHLLYFASFNQSFAVAGIAAMDRSIYLSRTTKFPIFLPGDFRQLVAQ
jgi:hypothetical protein